MTQYWWVNHDATFRQEIEGQYLWSPQREKLARSTAYDNMRRIQPGDAIISYAGQQNRHVGRATDFAVAAPKPSEFGTAGAYWSNTGWYVPVAWTALATAVRHRDFWDEFEPLLPHAHSPISRKTANGNQKVYLAEVSSAIYQIIVSRGGLAVDYREKAVFGRSADEVIRQIEVNAEAAIRQDLAIDATKREQLIAARRGQGVFRLAVERLGAACRVTGLRHAQLLVASHIKPWRSCTTADERLDGSNGLMLAPHIDRLFDRGFITFTDDGRVLVSPHIDDGVLQSLGCDGLRNRNVGPFSPSQQVYLAYHREHEFLAGRRT